MAASYAWPRRRATAASRETGTTMQYHHAMTGSAPGRQTCAMETSDQALVGLVAQGDRDALHVLFVRYNLRVYRFLLRFVDNEATAEDLLSEVFIEVWRHA